MDAQQELFLYFLTGLRADGYSVYDTDLPGPEVPYPFIYLGPTQDIYDPYKNGLVGSVTLTLDVYSDRWDQRGSFSGILEQIKTKAHALQDTQGWNWIMTGCNQQIIPDSTTHVPLMHGVIDLTFKYSKR